MNIKLFFEALIKFILGVVLVGLFIFVPAGTINYINGWLLMGLLFIPMFVAGIVMMIKSPDLLKSRLVQVDWVNSEQSKFEGEIQVRAVDRKGIINDITHAIAVEKVSLNGINARKGKEEIVNINLLIFT